MKGAASAGSISFGMWQTASARRRTYSAYPPSLKMPLMVALSQPWKKAL